MTYGAHVLTWLEDALAEAFQYHDALDAFVMRSGISRARLGAIRRRAEERAKQTRKFPKAPKRFVAQELLVDLGEGAPTDNQLVASLVTAFCAGQFPDSTPKAAQAIEALKKQRLVEREEAEKRKHENRVKEREKELTKEHAEAERRLKRDRFKESFLDLCQQTDVQARGYALEKFLNGFFSFENLNPRGSFRLVGEQIDGSFVWAGRTHLVEAKWVSAGVNGADFSSLTYKIGGKTADTRGLFVSINGYSKVAIEGLRHKGELRFVCLDGAHLMRCLEQGMMTLPELLDRVWRHASETGEAYLPVSAF